MGSTLCTYLPCTLGKGNSPGPMPFAAFFCENPGALFEPGCRNWKGKHQGSRIFKPDTGTSARQFVGWHRPQATKHCLRISTPRIISMKLMFAARPCCDCGSQWGLGGKRGFGVLNDLRISWHERSDAHPQRFKISPLKPCDRSQRDIYKHKSVSSSLRS